ncbi:hypothetical protein HPB47_018514 [Ixodes persulcatus]|uniref:Uncharacterized protein n=1 Tax=Ixodes persulcatus TaxID=34615 RepID=A0AC60R057_IXOPE|nr:hypothetical protein HPB47_018514 [Ixodes persulcatus]
MGTCLTVRRICKNGDVHCWSSQPIVNRRPLGNILVAAVTLYSGCIVKKVLRLFTQIGVPCISYRTFFKIQTAFLLPAIRQDWVQPIVKHLYWCAESSEEAPDEILPKWISLVGHVAGIHDHADPIYPRCQHGDLGKKKWLPEVYVRELLEEALSLNSTYTSYRVAKRGTYHRDSPTSVERI